LQTPEKPSLVAGFREKSLAGFVTPQRLHVFDAMAGLMARRLRSLFCSLHSARHALHQPVTPNRYLGSTWKA
jgi:hypothetical protein